MGYSPTISKVDEISEGSKEKVVKMHCQQGHINTLNMYNNNF